MKKIAGLWEITPIETPSGGCCTPVPPVYGKMYVSGQKMTFSGKSDGSSSVQTTYINMHKSSNGTLYMDKFGTILFDFSPEAGTFKLKNAFGYVFLFHRPATSVTIPNVSTRFDSVYVPPPAYSESIKM